MSTLNSRQTAALTRCGFVLAAIGTLVLLAAAGCVHHNAPVRALPIPVPPLSAESGQAINVGPVSRGEYVGNAACVPCHRDISRVHAASNHASTLRPMSHEAMAKVAPGTSDLPDTFFVFASKPDGFYIQEAAGTDSSRKLEYSFGSGKHGITFVSLGQDEKLFEMRSSYFPKEKRWGSTPGLEGMPPANSGLTFSDKASRACFSCHTTNLPSNTSRPLSNAIGVGCESCHGGGGEHVKLMQHAKDQQAEIGIARLRSGGATALDGMCIRCHQTTMVSNPFDSSLTMTARFAPGDIERSRCFKESANSLDCTKCHDPHTNAATDPRVYEKACLNCHGTGASARTCRVNPNKGCIPCHMPHTEVLPGTSAKSSVPDHFIRIHPSKISPPT